MMRFGSHQGEFVDMEYVGGVQNTNTNGQSITLDISTIGIQSGDLLIGVHVVGEDADRRSSMSLTSTGYTLISSLYGNDSYDINLEVYGKIADGTETSFITAGGIVTTASVGASLRVYRGPTAIPSTANGGLYDETTTANTDDITWPEVTGIAKGNMLVYIGATGHISGSPLYADPGDLTSFNSIAASDSEDFTFGTGNKLIDTESSFSAADWLVSAGGTTNAVASVILKLSDEL